MVLFGIWADLVGVSRESFLHHAVRWWKLSWSAFVDLGLHCRNTLRTQCRAAQLRAWTPGPDFRLGYVDSHLRDRCLCHQLRYSRGLGLRRAEFSETSRVVCRWLHKTHLGLDTSQLDLLAQRSLLVDLSCCSRRLLRSRLSIRLRVTGFRKFLEIFSVVRPFVNSVDDTLMIVIVTYGSAV